MGSVYGEHARIRSLFISIQKKTGRFYYDHLWNSKRKSTTENNMTGNEKSLSRG